MEYILTVIFCSVVVTILIGIPLYIAFKKDCSEKDFPKTIFSILVATLILFGAMVLAIYDDNINWNGGQCPDCEQNWEFLSVDKERTYTVYFYNCPECGLIISQGIQPEIQGKN